VSNVGYHGRPVLKPPVWKPEVPVYFFSGGLAGASATLALAARRAGRPALARSATFTSLVGLAAGPPLLISDLGRPARFLNMLRVLKVTSPMSIGTWVLTATAGAVGTAAACEATGRLPRVRSTAEGVGGLLGPALATYTGVLLADTAIPVWHEARRELPFLFAAGAAASAGAAVSLTAPEPDAGVARRLGVGAALAEAGVMRLMTTRLGPLARPYQEGMPGQARRLAETLSVGGALLMATPQRLLRRTGAVLVLGGALATRFAVAEAGKSSALDPAATVGPQRERLARRQGG
jgi:hypothetical protein